MINGVGTNALEATLDAVSEEPGFAHVTFGLESDWVDGCLINEPRPQTSCRTARLLSHARRDTLWSPMSQPHCWERTKPLA